MRPYSEAVCQATAKTEPEATRKLSHPEAMGEQMPAASAAGTTSPMTPSARLPLPVHDDQGGLAAAVGDPRSNRSLVDAADGLTAPRRRM